MNVPTSEQQLDFLSTLQRLFNEGDFTATYKFALLIALTEICVEQGASDNSPVVIKHTEIAEKFIGLYWQQSAPYSSGLPGTQDRVLIQNGGAQAAVVRAIVEFRRDNPGATPMAAARSSGYRDLVRTVATTVSAQPINYLQNLGGQTVQFLYERQRGAVRLLPGVSYCLRRFQPLINHLSRTRWVEHIKGNRLNTPLLGERDDLESFLFATPRQALAAIAVNLRKLVGGYCFYCSKPLQDADVDHFIPFSQYPRDLIHNFVLAHPSCNRSKGDALAAKPHLERWRDQVNRYTDQLTEIGAAAGRAANLQSSVAVARWSYGNAVAGGAQAWLKAKTYTKVDRGYLEVCA